MSVMKTIKPAAALVSIFAHYRGAAIVKLEKVARKAARYGQSITWTERPFVETVKRIRWDGAKVEVKVERIEFAIVGSAPRCGEFTFLSTLERVPGGVIISSIPGVEVGDLGARWDGGCQHCGNNRARRFAFVVEGPEGRKVVGRSCLRDHLGTDAPEGLLWQFATFADLASMGDEDEGGWGGSGRWEESTLGIVAAARASIALWGWRPSSGEGRSTRDYVNLVFGRVERDGKGREINGEDRRALRAELAARGDHYQAEADKVIAWGRALDAKSDYLHNLKVALAGDVVIGKTFALVVSACAAYDRQVAVNQKRADEAEARAALPASVHVGTVGERLTVGVTVERIIGLPDYGFGPSTIYQMRTAEGAILKWKTSTDAPLVADRRLEVGSRAVVTATVKAHGEYREELETVVLRAKFAPVSA